MKISELIEELKQLESHYEDIEVMTSSDYGDHGHTEQLCYIESIKLCNPTETAYSESGLSFPNPKYEDEDPILDENRGTEKVLVLRYI